MEYSLDLAGSRVVHDLLDNRASAVVHLDGAITIECGTADMAKYAEGGYRTVWHLGRDGDGGERAALVDGLGGALFLPLDGDPGGVRRGEDGSVVIALRARAARSRQLVSVLLNEIRLGDIAMPTAEWQDYRIEAPASALIDGENKLRFYFRHADTIDGRRTAAAISRIRFGRSGTGGQAGTQAARGLRAEPVMRPAPASRGDGAQATIAALRLETASRLSYYVRLPETQPALVFATAGDGAELAVAIAEEIPREPTGRSRGGETRTVETARTRRTAVWSGRAGERWAEQRVDLSAWAGRVVRLDLLGSGPADWGRPQIVAAPAPDDGVSSRLLPSLDDPAESHRADHVIVWVVSALRGDRVAGSKVPTPAFTRLAREGVHFTRAHTAAPAPGPAHVAMMAGIDPESAEMPPGVSTLAERFRQAGHATALISGNGFINDEAGFARGFSTYHNPMRRRHPFGARILWQKAKRILRRHKDGRTFLYIVTVEPHLPYRPSTDSLQQTWSGEAMPFEPVETMAMAEAVATGRRSLTREERGFITALYDAEVRDADAAFGEMLRDLDELGVRGRTAVILVGDHGEELWERGIFGHGRHLHHEVMDVPLVIAPPAGLSRASRAGRVVSRDVSLTDLHATLLDLAGIAPTVGTRSTSLLGQQSDALPRPILAHLPGVGRSLSLERYKLIVPLRGPRRLHDLRTDPDENVNLMESTPITLRYMRNVFGIAAAYRAAWVGRRWGRVNNVTPAFAADHGL